MISRAIILSLSDITRDSRVLRHCRALAAHGIAVSVISYGDPKVVQGLLEGDIAHFRVAEPMFCNVDRALLAVRLAAYRAMPSLPRSLAAANGIPGVRPLVEVTTQVLDQITDPTDVVIVANDWTALPAALMARGERGIPFHYDTHEFALEEHVGSLRWRILFPPLVEALEREGLARAKSVSCVSPGIAAAMRAHYALATTPEVLMSLPDSLPLPPKRPGEVFEVLYHGLFVRGRGIEKLIEAAATWPSTLRLTIRGKANSPAAEDSVRSAAEAGIAAGRVVLEGMVPQSHVISTASRADIGVFLPETNLRQNRFALPNKLFEYLFAGLVPVVPAGTDMAALLAQYGAGISLKDASPRGLLNWISGLTSEMLYEEKLKSWRAAKTLADEARVNNLTRLLLSVD